MVFVVIFTAAVNRSSKQLFKHQPHKMVKHTHTICQLLPTNCLSVLDHFVELALKGLRAGKL